MTPAHLLVVLPFLAGVAIAAPGNGSGNNGNGTGNGDTAHQAQVIILGGGIAGIAAARSLMTEHNITDILLIEARDELGGRAHTETLHNAITGKDITVEKGCNWIQGPGKEPILELAQKWGLKTARQNYSDTTWFGGGDGESVKGHWQSEAEQEEFMGAYDTYLELAPGYSGTYHCQWAR
jgi:polyamine oxidase